MSSAENELTVASQMRQVAGPYARAILAETPQGRFLVAVDDLYVGFALRMEGSFSTSEFNQLRSLCNSQTRLLVVGANIGAMAIPLAKVCKSVVAVEANPSTFELLALNVVLNQLQNMRVIQKAASNRFETIEFLMNVTNAGGSKRKPIINNPDYYYDNPQVTKVEAVPLDHLLAGDVFDVVIMDIEGSEYFALQGMQRILATVQLMQIEFLPQHLTQVAGVSVEEFLQPISPHFSTLIIGKRGLKVGREQFLPVLSDMFERNESDPGIFFVKAPPQAIQIQPSS
jgi:FkbM family methyltransferase